VSPDKLVYMANQIGRFFTHQGEEKAVASIADHLAKFWDPRMREAILAHLASGGAGLDPLRRAEIAENRISRLEPAERRLEARRTARRRPRAVRQTRGR
jgi:formate dehydrogenase subunit delta